MPGAVPDRKGNEMDTLNEKDLEGYSSDQVCSLADVDPIAVEKEGARRQIKAEKMMANAKRMMQKAQKMMREGELIILCARSSR